MNKLADWITVILTLVAALGWLVFFLHHQLMLSAWVGFGSLVFLAFCIWRWGLDSIYLPGCITGIGVGCAAGLACWIHRLYFVLACFVLVWILANILWWLIAPVPEGA